MSEPLLTFQVGTITDDTEFDVIGPHHSGSWFGNAV